MESPAVMSGVPEQTWVRGTRVGIGDPEEGIANDADWGVLSASHQRGEMEPVVGHQRGEMDQEVDHQRGKMEVNHQDWKFSPLEYEELTTHIRASLGKKWEFTIDICADNRNA